MTSANGWGLHNAGTHNTSIQLHTARLKAEPVRTSTGTMAESRSAIITRPACGAQVWTPLEQGSSDVKPETRRKASYCMWMHLSPCSCFETGKGAKHPKHGTGSIQHSHITKSDRQPTAGLRNYSFLHWLPPLTKHFLDIILYIKMWSHYNTPTEELSTRTWLLSQLFKTA